MGPIVAIIVAASWCMAALYFTAIRGYSPRGIALCLIGIIGGGVGAWLPGRYALTSWRVIVTSGNVNTMACFAILIGALCGLYVTERLRDNEFPSTRQLLGATFGFLFGGMMAYLLLFFSYNTWGHDLTMYLLIPATIGTAMLAGSAMSHKVSEPK